MIEKVIKSEKENGEYLLSKDIVDKADGHSEICISVFFRKLGEEDWEPLKSFSTMEEAEIYVNGEL